MVSAQFALDNGKVADSIETGKLNRFLYRHLFGEKKILTRFSERPPAAIEPTYEAS